MSFDLTGLGSYVQNGKDYALKSIMSANTATLLVDSGNFIAGLKGTQAIRKLSSNIVFSDGSTCGRSNASTTYLSNKNITTKQIKVEDSLCYPQLWNTFSSDSLKTGSSPNQEAVPAFAEKLMGNMVKSTAAEIEKLIWRGDSSITATTNNLRFFDGIVKQVTQVVTSAATGTTVVDKIQAAYLAVPAEIRSQDDFYIFVSRGLYDAIKIQMAKNNIYQPTSENVLFGTNAKLFPTQGLDGATHNAVFARLSNLYLGFDGNSDWSDAGIVYSNESKTWYLDMSFGLGVSTVYDNEAYKAQIA